MRREIRLSRDVKIEVECNIHGVRRPGLVRLGVRTPGPIRRLWWERAREWDWKDVK